MSSARQMNTLANTAVCCCWLTGDPALQVSFKAFAKWWSEAKEAARRATRRAVKEMFELIDRDGNGKLDKEEFALVCSESAAAHDLLETLKH